MTSSVGMRTISTAVQQLQQQRAGLHPHPPAPHPTQAPCSGVLPPATPAPPSQPHPSSLLSSSSSAQLPPALSAPLSQACCFNASSISSPAAPSVLPTHTPTPLTPPDKSSGLSTPAAASHTPFSTKPSQAADQQQLDGMAAAAAAAAAAEPANCHSQPIGDDLQQKRVSQTAVPVGPLTTTSPSPSPSDRTPVSQAGAQGVPPTTSTPRSSEHSPPAPPLPRYQQPTAASAARSALSPALSCSSSSSLPASSRRASQAGEAEGGEGAAAASHLTPRTSLTRRTSQPGAAPPAPGLASLPPAAAAHPSLTLPGHPRPGASGSSSRPGSLRSSRSGGEQQQQQQGEPGAPKEQAAAPAPGSVVAGAVEQGASSSTGSRGPRGSQLPSAGAAGRGAPPGASPGMDAKGKEGKEGKAGGEGLGSSSPGARANSAPVTRASGRPHPPGTPPWAKQQGRGGQPCGQVPRASQQQGAAQGTTQGNHVGPGDKAAGSTSAHGTTAHSTQSHAQPSKGGSGSSSSKGSDAMPEVAAGPDAAAGAGGPGAASRPAAAPPPAPSATPPGSLPYGQWRLVRVQEVGGRRCAACDGTVAQETNDGEQEIFECDQVLAPGTLAAGIEHERYEEDSEASQPHLWLFCVDPLCLDSKPYRSRLPAWWVNHASSTSPAEHFCDTAVHSKKAGAEMSFFPSDPSLRLNDAPGKHHSMDSPCANMLKPALQSPADIVAPPTVEMAPGKRTAGRQLSSPSVPCAAQCPAGSSFPTPTASRFGARKQLQFSGSPLPSKAACPDTPQYAPGAPGATTPFATPHRSSSHHPSSLGPKTPIPHSSDLLTGHTSGPGTVANHAQLSQGQPGSFRPPSSRARGARDPSPMRPCKYEEQPPAKSAPGARLRARALAFPEDAPPACPLPPHPLTPGPAPTATASTPSTLPRPLPTLPTWQQLQPPSPTASTRAQARSSEPLLGAAELLGRRGSSDCMTDGSLLACPGQEVQDVTAGVAALSCAQSPGFSLQACPPSQRSPAQTLRQALFSAPPSHSSRAVSPPRCVPLLLTKSRGGSAEGTQSPGSPPAHAAIPKLTSVAAPVKLKPPRAPPPPPGRRSLAQRRGSDMFGPAAEAAAGQGLPACNGQVQDAPRFPTFCHVTPPVLVGGEGAAGPAAAEGGAGPRAVVEVEGDVCNGVKALEAVGGQGATVEGGAVTAGLRKAFGSFSDLWPSGAVGYGDTARAVGNGRGPESGARAEPLGQQGAAAAAAGGAGETLGGCQRLGQQGMWDSPPCSPIQTKTIWPDWFSDHLGDKPAPLPGGDPTGGLLGGLAGVMPAVWALGGTSPTRSRPTPPLPSHLPSEMSQSSDSLAASSAGEGSSSMHSMATMAEAVAVAAAPPPLASHRLAPGQCAMPATSPAPSSPLGVAAMGWEAACYSPSPATTMEMGGSPSSPSATTMTTTESAGGGGGGVTQPGPKCDVAPVGHVTPVGGKLGGLAARAAASPGELSPSVAPAKKRLRFKARLEAEQYGQAGMAGVEEEGAVDRAEGAAAGLVVRGGGLGDGRGGEAEGEVMGGLRDQAGQQAAARSNAKAAAAISRRLTRDVPGSSSHSSSSGGGSRNSSGGSSSSSQGMQRGSGGGAAGGGRGAPPAAAGHHLLASPPGGSTVMEVVTPLVVASKGAPGGTPAPTPGRARRSLFAQPPQ
ncbi:hypothetical protein QJQ45_024380 [Haematococcus lacustris]|nr:hypothetical protein QJQ45_024380 [Haematococcus lacustris]